jgi:5-methyltetrahydrofolate--homocysteine methyltransferase
MDILQKLKNEILYLDGATGTMLQAMGLAPGELPETWNLRYPDRVASVHRAYYEAGSHIACTNTFGANSLKYDGKDGRPLAADVIKAAVECAKIARDTAVGGQTDRYIALDMGPLGRMLQPLGDLPFERAVALCAEEAARARPPERM